MKYSNDKYGTIQFTHRPRGDKSDGANNPYGVDDRLWVNIPQRGDPGARPGRTPREMLVWFWLGFAWGAVSCCAFTLAALSRGWLEAIL